MNPNAVVSRFTGLARFLSACGSVVFALAAGLFLVFAIIARAGDWRGIAVLGEPCILGALSGAALWVVGRLLKRFPPDRDKRMALLWVSAVLGSLSVLYLMLPPRWSGGPWRRQVSGVTAPLYAISGTPDGRHLWIVGYKGTILHTDDGGEVWRQVETRVTEHLRRVHVSEDGRRIWISTDGGLILHSYDGGQNWATQDLKAPDGRDWLASADDGSQFWARSRRSGVAQAFYESGTRQTSMIEDEGLRDIFSTRDRSMHLVIGGSSSILRSVDRGRTWQKQYHSADEPLFSIFGTEDAADLWVTGHVTILHSDDKGETWSRQSTEAWPEEISGSRDASCLWAVGDLGTILYSGNRGANWTRHDSHTDERLSGVFVSVDGSEAWAVGAHGIVLHVAREE